MAIEKLVDFELDHQPVCLGIYEIARHEKPKDSVYILPFDKSLVLYRLDEPTHPLLDMNFEMGTFVNMGGGGDETRYRAVKANLRSIEGQVATFDLETFDTGIEHDVEGSGFEIKEDRKYTLRVTRNGDKYSSEIAQVS